LKVEALMPSPFPGMDPYLEDPALWRGVHARLVNECSALLQPQLNGLGYFVDIEEQIYLGESERHVVPDVLVHDVPDIATAAVSLGPATAVVDEPVLLLAEREPDVKLRYLAVRRTGGESLVTVIEFLSPVNKFSGPERRQYLRKRRELGDTGVHLVEVDLLRAGPRVWDVPEERLGHDGHMDYFVTLVRANDPSLLGYPIRLQDRLPRVRVPLADGDPDAVLDLQSALNTAYDRGPYRMRVDYTAAPPPPALTADDSLWLDHLLRDKGLRQ
jgi:hypothetical protein